MSEYEIWDLWMKIQETSILKIGLNIVYCPFIPFMIIIMIYILMDMITELKVLFGIGGEEAVKKMLNETRDETHEAINAAMAQGAAGKEREK